MRTSSRIEASARSDFVSAITPGARAAAGRCRSAPGLRHHRFVGRDNEQDPVDAGGAGEHVLTNRS